MLFLKLSSLRVGCESQGHQGSCGSSFQASLCLKGLKHVADPCKEALPKSCKKAESESIGIGLPRGNFNLSLESAQLLVGPKRPCAAILVGAALPCKEPMQDDKFAS